MTKASARRKAFTLFEVLIALAVFVLAALGIGQAISGTADAALAARNHSQIRTVLESRLAYCQALPPKPGQVQRTEISGLLIEESLRPANLKNSEGNPLEGLFELTITATRKNPAESDKVSVLVHRADPAGGSKP
jgi:prepilin-type N-terminal cleavage/methylation domain-containing protein